MGELLPCPFCGRDDSTENAVQEACVVLTTFKSPAGGRAHRVECCCGTHGSSARAAEEAIAAWNTRMTPPQDSVSDVERAQWRQVLNLARNPGKTRADLATALAMIADVADAALAVPINKIGEDAK